MTIALRRRQPALAFGVLALVLARTIPAAADEPEPRAAPAAVEGRPESPPTPQAAPPRPAAPTADSARRAEADERRQRALRFYDAGNYSAARGEFERANQLMPNFRLFYNLGVVSMALADSASAYEFFERYLREGGDSVSPEVRRDVTAQLRDLSEQVSTIIVQVSPPGAQVFIDESLTGPAPLARPVRANPGSHRITARLTGRKSESRTLELAGGETVRVELRLEPPATLSVKSPTRIFWIGWTATTLLAAGAAFTGLEALSAQHDYEQKLATVGDTRSELDRLDTRATRFSIAADTLGAAAIITGAYSLYMTLKHPKHDVPAAKTGFTNSMQSSASQLRFGFAF